jgi:hypothetical protein
MKNQPNINESLVSRFEWIREEVATAIDEIFKPVFAEPAIESRVETPITNDDAQTRAEILMVWQLDQFSIYEKAVLTYMLASKERNQPVTSIGLAEITGISLGSIKRAIASLKSCSIIINHPSQPGFILNAETTI